MFPRWQCKSTQSPCSTNLDKDKPDTVVAYVGVNDVLNGADHDDLIKRIADIKYVQMVRDKIHCYIWFNLHETAKEIHTINSKLEIFAIIMVFILLVTTIFVYPRCL